MNEEKPKKLGRPKKQKPICTEAGCSSPTVGRNLCRKHLTYWNRGFNPTLSSDLSKVINLDDELLTSIAKLPPSTVDHLMTKENFTEVQMFCIARKLQQGDDLIQGQLVYHLYRKWTPEPMSYDEFNPQFRRFFDKVLSYQLVFYKLNKEPFLELAGNGEAEYKNGKLILVQKEKT